jgi:putative protease
MTDPAQRITSPVRIELLAPARDLSCGIAAINHGADAVYIGAPQFSARAAAGNDPADIERLVRHAHRYFGRVYVALNTLLTDAELDEAAAIARTIWNAGADAMIIQDMGLLECDLPPIPLHASTQTDNRTADKVRFLEQAGFSQVVLARELGLEEIRAIRAATTVPLECFIHGALCVCYSGRCYISEKILGRSANRGECAQFCRHRWTMKDLRGREIDRERYFLSLKDLNLSAHIGELLAAGVSSLKIEGRLKDERYVKNVTAAYRLILDRLIGSGERYGRSSSGECRFGFEPDAARSFNRGRTEYFLLNSHNRPGSIDTPKAIGQEVGTVAEIGRNWFTLQSKVALSNGDGLCCLDGVGSLIGFRANRVEGQRIFPREMIHLEPGTVIYRNHDSAFVRQLDASAECRQITIDMLVVETAAGLRCTVRDEDGCVSVTDREVDLTVRALTPGRVEEIVRRQMAKSGGTIFRVREVRIEISPSLHLPAAVINDLRREALQRHADVRLAAHVRPERIAGMSDAPWPAGETACLAHVTNRRAEMFYRRHGVTAFPPSPAGADNEGLLPLMTSRYCVRRQLGICGREKQGPGAEAEPLLLCDNTGCYVLQFDCEHCEMLVLQGKNPQP